MKRMLVASIILMSVTEAAHAEHSFEPPLVKTIEVALGLTTDQKQQVDQIFASKKDQIMEKMSLLFDKQQALQITLSDDAADEAEIRSASKEFAAAQEEVFVEHGTVVREINAILTEEQRKKNAPMYDSLPLPGMMPLPGVFR